MRTKDIMTSMSVSEYLEQIMKIPLCEEGTPYNSSGKRAKTHCTATRTYGKYRSLCWREASLKTEIRECTVRLGRLMKIYSDEFSDVRRERKKLRDLWLMLGKVQLEKRKLEDMQGSIKNDFLRQIVQYRYFESSQKSLPSWTETAKYLGIAVKGEELRRYVCNELF